MDLSRLLYTLAEIYVLALVVVSLVTLAWVFDFFERSNAEVAGIWFAIGGFGALVLITFLIVYLTRG